MSGLLYAAIVAVWLAVLIPMWLRRHDDAAQSRSADRYTRAMRTLSRRPAAVGSREIVMPPRPQAGPQVALATAGGGPAGHPVTAPVGGPRAVPRHEVPPAGRGPSARRRPDRRTRAASASLARRRARSLLVLAVLTVVVLGLGLLGVVPVWVAAFPALLLVGFLVHLRLQARRAAQRRRRGAQPVAAKPAATPKAGSTARRGQRPAEAGDEHASRAVVVESKNDGTLGGAAATQPAAHPAEGTIPEGYPAETYAEGDPDDEAWRPQSWPLPTYVTKPKAVRPVRVIDLTTPGAWTSGRLLDDEAEPVEDVLAAAAETTLELDAIVDRAVND